MAPINLEKSKYTHGDSSGHTVLIIGCGSIGERHARCFSQTQRARVTVCDSNRSLAETMQKKYGLQVAEDWRDALASGEYECVVICTPAPLHVPMAVHALKNRVHTLIEKPLSHSLDGVEDLLTASKDSSCKVAVAYVYHANPVLVQARRYLRDKDIAVKQVTVTAGQPFYKYRPAYARSYYRDHRSGGGAIQDALTHTANWVESVVGPAESVMCDCAHQVLPEVEVEDTVHLHARHGDVLASFTLNQFQAPAENTIQFHARTESVKIELHRHRWGVFSEEASDWHWHEVPSAGPDGNFIEQAHAFLDEVEGAPSRLCSLPAAIQSLRFNLAALASAKSGTRVFCRDTSI